MCSLQASMATKGGQAVPLAMAACAVTSCNQVHSAEAHAKVCRERELIASRLGVAVPPKQHP